MKKLLILTAVFIALVCATLWYSGNSIALDLPNLSDLFAKPAPTDSDNTETDDGGQAETKTNLLQSLTEVRAVWVATAYAIDYPSEPTTDAEALKARCNEILDKIAADGFNTVYFQVRPAADALYPSDLFPWSRYLTGTPGAAPSDNFDPLAYWVEQAHTRGLKLQAWINPYRICAGQNAAAEFEALPDSSPAKQHPEWVVQDSGGYYFNPGIAEVRQLICDGVEEIVANYDVDGIQFDDYFYPSTDFADEQTYAASGSELSRDDWRRENVNLLVQAVGEVVHTKAKNPICEFGISPSGIWRNKGINVPNGSDTNGYEHYTSAYADSLTWIENNWIDYICPQIYWEIGDESADFDTLARWWAHQVEGTDVKLILGLAAYKIGSTEYTDVWRTDGVAEIARQIELGRSIENVSGFAIFSYRNLEQIAGLSDVFR